MRLRRVLALAGLALLAPACGKHHSVLTEGVSLGSRANGVHVIEAAEAFTDRRAVVGSWNHELRTRAKRDTRKVFPNLSQALLRSRLASVARRYGFQIVSVRLLRPRQLAPMIVVRTSHYLELARAARTILPQLDPKVRTRDDRTGWRYEGFYFEAQDEHAVPFLIVFNFWRGTSPGGGQWARSERLFPFPHG